MRTGMRLILAPLCLALAGLPALAEESGPPAAEPQGEAALEPAAEPQAERVVPAPELAVEESAPSPEPAPAAAEPQPEPAPMAAVEPAVPASEEAAPPAAPAPAAAPALGMVGYDSEGRKGRIHLVVRGDTLWDISNAYLGTPWVWPSIWQDNTAIENPHLIYPGDHIWITPTEMRKLGPGEVDALLAGQPAAPEEERFTPEPEAPASAPAVLREERQMVRVNDRETVGLIGEDELEAAGSIVGSPEERVLLSNQDRVWISIGEGETRPGDRFTVFRPVERVIDPETGGILGHHVYLLGWLEVVETHPESSLAIVRHSQSEMEVGERLMPRSSPVTEIPVVSSPEVEGQISFLAHQRTLAGSMDFVYLNRGTLDGVEVGTPLRVIRPGFEAQDRIRHERVQVPDRVVAELLVVRAQPGASVALVRRTEAELALGDRFRGGN